MMSAYEIIEFFESGAEEAHIAKDKNELFEIVQFIADEGNTFVVYDAAGVKRDFKLVEL